MTPRPRLRMPAAWGAEVLPLATAVKVRPDCVREMLWGTALTVTVTASASVEPSRRSVIKTRLEYVPVGSDGSTETCSDACARAAIRPLGGVTLNHGAAISG